MKNLIWSFALQNLQLKYDLSRRREPSTWLPWSYQSRNQLPILLVSSFTIFFSTYFQEGLILLLIVANLLHWITVSSYKWGGSFQNSKWKIPLSCGMDPCMSSNLFCNRFCQCWMGQVWGENINPNKPNLSTVGL